LVIEFEDNKSNAICETIGHQLFKLGGLFHTALVTAESIDEEAEENEKQITWMEEEEVQAYLRFKSNSNREVIWGFIVSAQAPRTLRSDGSPLSQPDQSFMATKTVPEISERVVFPMPPDSINSTESTSSTAINSNILALDQNVPPLSRFPSSLSGVTSRKREKIPPLPPIIVDDPNDTIEMKRARNTLAARKSRQRKMQRFEEMEDEIARLTAERDHWKSLTLKRTQQNEMGNALRGKAADLLSATDMGEINMEVTRNFEEIDTHGTDDRMLD